MRYTLLLLLLALPQNAVQPIPVLIQNPSFEQPALTGVSSCGPYAGPVQGWTSTLLVAGGGAGIFQPSNNNPCGVSLAPHGTQVAYLFHASISQNLGPAQTNGIYTMKFFVANRFYWYASQYTASLTVGQTQLCSASGLASGDFTEITLVCPTQRIYGDLILTLSNNAPIHGYGDFMLLTDNFSLGFTSVN